jgi:hypothetical protein
MPRLLYPWEESLVELGWMVPKVALDDMEKLTVLKVFKQ